jgi:hypothetical protein
MPRTASNACHRTKRAIAGSREQAADQGEEEKDDYQPNGHLEKRFLQAPTGVQGGEHISPTEDSAKAGTLRLQNNHRYQGGANQDLDQVQGVPQHRSRPPEGIHIRRFDNGKQRLIL